VIIGDVVPSILGVEDPTAGQRALAMTLCSLFVMYPLSILKDMSSLAFTSSLSCLADVALVLIVLAETPAAETVAAAGGFGEVLRGSVIKPATMFSGLGAMSFAFVCHHSSFIVANSLENPTKERWGLVTHLSVGTAAVMCVSLGLAGYLGFLEETQGDVLNNFGTSPSLTAARVMLGLTMFFTYPMESFVARHTIVALRYGEEAVHDIPDKRR
jgi:sodium-coupled neutral amino acid transporter 11